MSGFALAAGSCQREFESVMDEQLYTFRWQVAPYRSTLLWVIVAFYATGLVYFQITAWWQILIGLLAIVGIERLWSYYRKDAIAYHIQITPERIKVTNPSSTLWLKETAQLTNVQQDVVFDAVVGEQNGILFTCQDGDSFRLVTRGVTVDDFASFPAMLAHINTHFIHKKAR